MRRYARRALIPSGLGVLAALVLASPQTDYFAARRKIDMIQREVVPAGSTVTFSKAELNAYVINQARKVAPEGVRNPRLELGYNRATAFADIDFAKLQRAQGKPMGWLMEQLLGGEHPVRVDARIRSGRGQATVDVDQVVISGITISGGTLDYLIRNFLWSYYPDAKVGKPFELAHRMDHFEVTPAEARVVIAR